MRQGIGAKEGTETTEKGGMIVWEVEAKRALASPVPDNSGIGHFPENHIDTGIACILERRVSAETIHGHTDMTTVIRIPRRNGNPTMLPWTK